MACVTLNFMGDVMLGEMLENYKRGVSSKINKSKVNPFENCNKVLETSDLNIANLECVISDHSEKSKPFSDFLRVPSSFSTILKDNDIHIVNLANNHSLDHGSTAFKDMVNLLNNNGIETFGYSVDLLFQENPIIITIKNFKIGFIGYNIANLPETKLSSIIEKINKITIKSKKQVDLLVLSLHWGYEYVDFPAPKFVAMGKRFIENGADILFGHHSHMIQGVTKYKEKILAPSLGNFVFDNRLKSNRLSGILRVKIDTQSSKIDFDILPYFINGLFQPEPRNDLLPKLINLNESLTKIVSCQSKAEAIKWNNKALRKSNVGHLKNRIMMRLFFIIHIENYYPYIWKILKKKLLNGKVFSAS